MKGVIGVSVLALLAFGCGSDHDFDDVETIATASPIKHVIILIGENRGLDHTFGLYKPRGSGQTIANILSKGIVNADGTPGPDFAAARQFSVSPQPLYYVTAPEAAKTPYGPGNPMPQPNTTGAPTAQRESRPPFKTTDKAGIEKDLAARNTVLLTTGATGLPEDALDTRVPGAGMLPNGPFMLQGPNLTDDDYTGDMTHRFYQAWQQQDCNPAHATRSNPTGCLNDLFPFVVATHAGTNKGEGNEMGFLDIERAPASLLRTLADRFTLSDNFHQSFLGGTGSNHFMLGTGDAGFWSDGKGNATTPPSNVADPNPIAGTANQYIADNNFSDCSDLSAPGVKAVVDGLAALPYKPAPNCEPGHFYLLNNTNPGFLANGAAAGPGALPPSPVRTIGDALSEKHISWAYFAGAYRDAVILANAAVAANPANPKIYAAALADPAHALGVAYCQICNPFQYAASIMSDAAVRTAHLRDTADLIADIKGGKLPAVSFGKPDVLLDGHPQSSKIDLFEAYLENILDALEANPRLKATTAVFVTWDEAGGYWDSGFVQPLDFFGDGSRIPLLVLSPYSTGGRINHGYADHVSLLKFIERNWHLAPLTPRSRDNLPDPVARADDPYVPANMPAISDLFDAFDFQAPPIHQRFVADDGPQGDTEATEIFIAAP